VFPVHLLTYPLSHSNQPLITERGLKLIQARYTQKQFNGLDVPTGFRFQRQLLPFHDLRMFPGASQKMYSVPATYYISKAAEPLVFWTQYSSRSALWLCTKKVCAAKQPGELRQPRGDTRATPEDRRLAIARRAAEVKEHRAIFAANSNANADTSTNNP
jgi:hypothetical protein